MPAIAKKLKDKLEAEGKWKDFVRYRQDLKEKYGNVEAHHRAIAHFFEDVPSKVTQGTATRKIPLRNIRTEQCGDHGADDPEGGGGAVSPLSPTPPAAVLSPEERQIKEKKAASAYIRERRWMKKAEVREGKAKEEALQKAAEARKEKEEARDAIRVRKKNKPRTPEQEVEEQEKAVVKEHSGGLPPLPVVKREVFEGKKASEVEEVRWVKGNMAIENPCPEDCPSSGAWALLKECRESYSFRADFWKGPYAKLLPSRAQMDKEIEEGKDVGRASEVIEDLLNLKNKAKEVMSAPEPEAVACLPEPEE